MRTTIDIPAKLRQRLIAEAAKRNLKGFSFIIVNALEEYFESDTTQSSASEIRKLRGSLSKAEYGEAMALLKEGRRGWRE